MLAFSSIDDMPPETGVDKKTWIEWGIRSNPSIPILTGETVDHVIAINSVKRERVWPEEFISGSRNWASRGPNKNAINNRPSTFRGSETY